MLSTGQGLKDLTGNVHIDTLECRNLSATNFDIQNLQVSASLVPTQDNTVDLGSTAKRFKRAYVNDIDLGVARASKQLKTDASGVVAFDPLLSVGTSHGLTLNSGTQVLDLALASGSGSGAITSSTYNDIVANTGARHTAVTLGTSNGLSLSGQQLSLQTATTLVPGAASAALVTDVAANTTARHAAVTLGTANGLSLSGQQLSLGTASSGTTGALTMFDWDLFNSKQTTFFVQGAVTATDTLVPTASVPPGVAGITPDLGNNLYVANKVGVNTKAPGVRLHIADDAGTKLLLTGKTQVNRELALGYNVSTNVGFAQAAEQGVAVRPLHLNPSGGRVAINTDQTKGLCQIGSTAHVTSAIPGLCVNSISGNWTAIDAGSELAENRVVLGTLGGKATVGGHNDAHSAWSDLILNPADANVGIGTAAPVNKLHVATDSGGLTIGHKSVVARQLVLGYDASNTQSYIQSVEQGIDVRPITLNPDGGNIGIGTRSIAYRLHVKSGDVNVEAGTYRRDGLAIQNFVAGTRTGSMNLGVSPYYLVWTELAYVDLPYAGTWRCTGKMRYYYDCNSCWFEDCFSITSGALGNSHNVTTHHLPNLAGITIYVGPEGLFTVTGPVRVYLNGRVGFRTGTGDFILNGGELYAYRVS